MTSKTQTNATIRNKSSFGRTSYFLDVKKLNASETKDKGPGQLRGMIRWMIDNKITSASKAMNGAEIGTKAVADGHVVTAKLTGPVIFAYYARKMEKDYGLILADVTHAKTGKSMMK